MELEKEFVPFDLALELKGLGFDKPCLATIDQTDYLHINGTKRLPRGSMMYDTIDCPTFSQAFRFFREKYKIFTNNLFDGKFMNSFEILTEKGDDYISGKEFGYFNTPEEAELECLIKLIEIVKTEKF
jgi:hypothetical protein